MKKLRSSSEACRSLRFSSSTNLYIVDGQSVCYWNLRNYMFFMRSPYARLILSISYSPSVSIRFPPDLTVHDDHNYLVVEKQRNVILFSQLIRSGFSLQSVPYWSSTLKQAETISFPRETTGSSKYRVWWGIIKGCDDERVKIWGISYVVQMSVCMCVQQPWKIIW